MVPSIDVNEIHASERENLQSQLLSSVKNCQTRFGGKTEIATELDLFVGTLCNSLELVLSHGLKIIEKKNSAIKHVTELVLGTGDKYTIWDVTQTLLTSHERERYELLRQVWTDRGRARAWIRSAINERSLERYLSALIISPTLPAFFEEWAFVRTQEYASILPNMAAGLSSIVFALSIDRPELNQSSIIDGAHSGALRNEYVLEDPAPVPEKKKTDGKKSKKVTKIISFGDDVESKPKQPSQSQINTFVHSSPSTEIEIADGDSENLEDVECAEEATGALCDLDLSNSDTETKADNNSSNSNLSSGLRPLNNCNVGELTPVQVTEETHSSEDSLSVPSFSEEGDPGMGNINIEQNISPIECKDNLQQEYDKLVTKLEQVQESNELLNSQLMQLTKQNQQKQNQLETKIQELNRENELLKHQLRKYVSAVQMLKQDGQEFEGEELFQQKLVQVAEMHGELMELNDRLQRNLIAKESVIRRLYLELEALRGPLGPTEIDVSTQIISLWVPSVFLTGPPKQHHVYQVHIRIANEEWNVYRRYSQFYILHKQTKKQYPVISAFQFPPKKTIGNKDTKFVEERRLKLQHYLRRLLNHIVANNTPLSSAPNKTILTSIIPFFGEPNNSPVQQRQNPRPSFPRPPNAPQYSGL
ncbi:sorting nexin-29-like isoform X2 [Rhodnius prolixus]|uniref:sorting nexin-29-like isoform X2 n=1 Tax=Rhodnius prolixus TaxID=13249 RepID=UPI003D18E4B4